MAHSSRLPFLLALIVSLASGVLAQPFDSSLPLLDFAQHAATVADDEASRVLSGGEQVFGHLNVVGIPTTTRDGIGHFVMPDTLPPSFFIPVTKIADNPLPYDSFTPEGGTLGPGGLFYFIGRVGADVSNLALYTLDPEAPNAGYDLVNDEVDEGLLSAGMEYPIALGYNADTGAAVLATRLCSEVEGTYYQSLLYEINLTTGELGNHLELRDPAAPAPDNAGICLFSASWEEGGAVFGADSQNDIVEIDAASGVLVERHPILDSSSETIERVQAAAFNDEQETHHVFAFSLQRDDNGEVIAAYTRAFRCSAGEGCDFLGYVVDHTQESSYTVEVLTATFLPGQPVAVDPDPSSATATLGVYPNPVTSRASVSLRLSKSEAVSVTIRDVLGRTVAVLHDGKASQLDLAVDGAALPSGIYLVHAYGESFSVVRKLVVAH